MITVFRVKRDRRIISWPDKLTDKVEGNPTEGR